MTCYVDCDSHAVRNAEANWPFVLDWTCGDALIDIGERSYVLHPLGWRQKCHLARYAHLGEQFLQTQFLCASLGARPSELPKAGTERAVLSTLARWLNAPDGNLGLPLDQQLLTSVTLDMCRDMQLPPSAFDTLEASDVESLWRASRAECAQRMQAVQSNDATANIPLGMTRIVLLPNAGSNTDGNEIKRIDIEKNTATATPQIPVARNFSDVSTPLSNALSTSRIEPKLSAPMQLNGAAVAGDFPSINLPQSRKTVVALANRFRVDLSTVKEVQKISARAAHGNDGVAASRQQAKLSRSNGASTETIAPTFLDEPASSAPATQAPSMTVQRASTLLSHARWPEAAAPTSALQPEITSQQQSQLHAVANEQLFAEFAEHLDEAVKAAGIDLEN
ncbi:MAG TPA: hypothetical protein VGK97_07570 [Spongiibacteraceae bacterium]